MGLEYSEYFTDDPLHVVRTEKLQKSQFLEIFVAEKFLIWMEVFD